jgi:5'-3' exonuclease
MHTCEEDLDYADPEEYLTGLPGVGPKTAERLVEALGNDMDDIRKALSGPEEEVVQRLVGLKMPNIGRAGALKLKRAWDERQGKWLMVDLLLLHSCA